MPVKTWMMTENENAQLRKEIERQNQLMDIVLLRNKQLESWLDACTAACDEVATLLHSYIELWNKAPKLQHLIKSEIIGVKMSFCSYDEQTDEAIKPQRLIRPENIGVNKPFCSYDEQTDEATKPHRLIRPENIGVNKLQTCDNKCGG